MFLSLLLQVSQHVTEYVICRRLHSTMLALVILIETLPVYSIERSRPYSMNSIFSYLFQSHFSILSKSLIPDCSVLAARAFSLTCSCKFRILSTTKPWRIQSRSMLSVTSNHHDMNRQPAQRRRMLTTKLNYDNTNREPAVMKKINLH